MWNKILIKCRKLKKKSNIVEKNWLDLIKYSIKFLVNLFKFAFININLYFSLLLIFKFLLSI